MYDDAKKILRRVLIYHPTEKEARKNLEEIQKIELDQILQGDEPSLLRKEKTESPEEVLEKTRI